MLLQRFVSFIFLLTMAIQPGAAQQRPESEEVTGKISWVYDYEEGRQISRQQDKPMFVVFRCER